MAVVGSSSSSPPSEELPLRLTKSETIPPSPNRSESSIDWCPDYSGLSWIAYGASSLLVISHFPSPGHQTLTAPVHRQSIELSTDPRSVVKALAWSPSVPSQGDIAVAIDNCICLCSDTSSNTQASFYWIKVAVLVQSYDAEAIKWTVSGDGIVSAGREVVFWKRNNTSWEIAWKFTPQQPQTMLSTTQGLVATAGPLVDENVASRNVLVCHMDHKAGLVKSDLLTHPQSVSMIQWRPLVNQRAVLLTCCLDGTVRLWSEIDNGRGKNTNRPFHVIAVVEVNKSLNGTPGVDMFVTWATEIRSIDDEGVNFPCATKGSVNDTPGRCEWLIGYGPRMLLSFWAIHCLDDISPLRFPRVSLWKTLDLSENEGHLLQASSNLNIKDRSLFIKAVISRSQLNGPPTTCSLFQLSDNSLGWSQIYTLESASNTKDECLSLDGHSGNILQVAIHPYSCEIELAVSLDSYGFLLFWCLSTISSFIPEMPALVVPTWKLAGKIATKHLFSVEYTCLRWAPSILNNYSVLLLGHSNGIDCFIINIAESESKRAVHHKLCTIAFTGHNRVDGPTNIFAIPLPSTCRKTFISNHFMLLGIWNGFQALSWKVTLHSDDLSGSSCDCNSNFTVGDVEHDTWRYESSFAGKKYCVVAELCSSKLPDSHKHDQVTSVAVVSPASLVPSVQQKWYSSNSLYSKPAPYHMAIGYSDGSLRLWKSTCSKSSIPHSEPVYLPWELVGMFIAHQGPIAAISLSCCGGKIATFNMEKCPDNFGTLCIWRPVRLINSGKFLLEDKISLNGVVVALSWFSIGNGQLLLGVCMQNELRVYAQRSCGNQMVVKSGELSETHIWYCISVGSTSLAVKDFLWGPGAIPVLVHERYFSLYSKWSSHLDKEHQTIPYVQCSKDNSPNYIGGTATDPICVVFTDCNICSINEQPSDGKSKKCKPQLPSMLNMAIDYPVCYLFPTNVQQQYDSCIINGPRTLLEVAGKSRGSLPTYHPDVLLLNLYSGNWRQACVAVRHLVECLTLDCTSVPNDKAQNSKILNHVIPLMHLSTYFEEPSSAGLGKKGLLWGSDVSSLSSAAQSLINSSSYATHNADASGSYNTCNSGSGKSETSGFIETIEKFSDITAINSAERTQMLALIDLLGEISDSSSASAYENLDEPGRRFWVALRFQQLLFLRQFGTLASTNELVVDSGTIAWAFQSDCQDNLLTSFLSNEPSWKEMRNLGAGFWFSNATQLRTRMEKLARSQYLKNRDPKDCALLYIALNRIQVLAGLFKMSRNEKDKPLVGFLSRNFQDEKNKSAALKNAYVLMGRHQLELAIAFFLLGGDTSSAISVCARTLGDEQLALVICRLLEGNGGQLERHIIYKSLLPAAIERGDCWLASLFEWTLGNYVQSFLRLLGFEKDKVKSVLRSNQNAFLDPTVGQYCLILATKNFMRNYIGESATVVLTKWATLMTSIALNRRGLPIEALRCLSSSVNVFEGKDGGSVVDLEKHDIPHGILEESSDTSNWLYGDVAAHLESTDKLDLALHYVSNLIVEHPSWIDTTALCRKPLVRDEEDSSDEYKLLLEKFQHKLNAGFATFEQRYSLNPLDMLNMIFVFSCNNGILFLGYHLLHGYSSREFLQDDNHTFDSISLYPPLPQLFLKATREITCFFAQYLMCFSMIYSPPKRSLPVCKLFGTIQSRKLLVWDVYMRRCIHLLEGFKATLRMYCPNFYTESFIKKTLIAVDLLKYYIIFTSAWLQKNLKGLILAIYPLLITSEDGNTPSDIDIESLSKHLCQNAEVITYDSCNENIGGVSVMCKQGRHERSGELVVSIPEDEKWQIIGACLWRHLFNFTRDLMKSFPDVQANNSSLRSLSGKISPSIYANGSNETATEYPIEAFMQVPELFAKVLDNTLECIASSHTKHFASVVTLKLEKGIPDPTLAWLVQSGRSHSRSSFNIRKLDIDNLHLISNGNEGSLFEVLWDMSVDPTEICKAFSQKSRSWLHSSIREFSKGWSEVHKGILSEYETGNTSNHDHERNLSSSANGEGGSPRERRFQDNSGFPRPRQKDSTLVKVDAYFRNPVEIYKRNGELLEAMCVNSINQQQAAVSTNRKGILFFEWKDEDLSKDISEYIWSQADWPTNGWAGSESTPLPTFVSPGIGQGSKKGAHLGLGGATVGRGSLVKPGTGLTYDRTFGIPGYSGAGASGLGWGTQEDFEFVDSPATVDNISTRALSSHPSRPFFLAGSSNTHIYLWEFGKKKAVATYGVLPAANVPPPYALASIEALQFDNYGQRFATAALDGTVCTWQLEVGGRSNIHPTESSLCFDRHALDVTYIAASGSVIAAAGYGSDDVNVVVWDTLAPTTTSQASLVCHEGGARSVSVFDKNIGSGSISPLIVTGGKGGDVGLHDFRFIVTGKTKRHRHPNNNEQNTKYSSTHETHSGDSNKFGEQNLKGMLWYIPKAHSGSITRIATIPDTSFFLTGSKDGDVKLWDAKKAELVFHWPKLHERHTFLQPSSRGFGGIVRAAVTDIQVLSKGFLTCGGDGAVKLVQIKDFSYT